MINDKLTNNHECRKCKLHIWVHAPYNHAESSDRSIWLDNLSDENEILTDYGEAFVCER